VVISAGSVSVLVCVSEEGEVVGEGVRLFGVVGAGSFPASQALNAMVRINSR
jgi:hypothetical protein